MEKKISKKEEKELLQLMKFKNPKNIQGRPEIYSEELGKKICDIVASHPWGLKRICREYPELPHESTIRLWKINNANFFALYARAKVDQADCFAEDCIDISDESKGDTKINANGDEVFDGEYVARARLRVDTRKWMAAKLLPKLYGDRVALEQKEEENVELREEVRQLRAKLDDQNKRDY